MCGCKGMSLCALLAPRSQPVSPCSSLVAGQTQASAASFPSTRRASGASPTQCPRLSSGAGPGTADTLRLPGPSRLPNLRDHGACSLPVHQSHRLILPSRLTLHRSPLRTASHLEHPCLRPRGLSLLLFIDSLSIFRKTTAGGRVDFGCFLPQFSQRPVVERVLDSKSETRFPIPDVPRASCVPVGSAGHLSEPLLLTKTSL